MSKETKELVKKEETQVAQFEAPSFESEGVNVEDIAFPRIQAMQPISESVVEGKYAAGDIINSFTGEVLGSSTKQVEIIPLRCRKYYKIMKVIDANKKEFARIEPINSAQDMQKDWNFEENGNQMIRRPVMEVFVLIPGHDLPFIWRLSGMSYKGLSKQFYTSAFALPASQKKAPFVRSLLIQTKKEKNEKGVYFVFSFINGKLTDKDTYELANTWYESTKTAKIQDDQDDDEPKASSSASENNVGF